MEWTDETIARLRELWAEGHSTAEIGRRMGISKNAVVGKAHRLNLLARPSPIRRDSGDVGARPHTPRRVTGPTLPPLSVAPPPPPPVSQQPLPVVPPVAPAVTVRPEAVARAPMVVRPVAARSPRAQTCCWPVGEPGTRSFRFCDADATLGKPYCTEHAAVAYVRVRDKREEAAA
jgi:GcrA cell cycle regulator